jgi:perosamine synthetase
MSILAINGGTPIRTTPFNRYRTIGDSEESAVSRVLKSGNLSGFYGSFHDGYLGGPEVQALESEWAKYFGAKFAVSMNSATSGLIAAVGAAGISPGDEVIVTPISMSATATAIVVWGGVPIFADIDPDTYCLDPESVESRITDRTKAIVVTNIFGQPYDAITINDIASRHHLAVIEDNAQGPGAMFGHRYAGTLGDMGIFSLNYHKHIHTGEGGIVCTDDPKLADRLRMIRNHAEAVAGGRIDEEPDLDLTNMIGFNFRMGEIEAAIAREQLPKLADLVASGVQNVKYLEKQLVEIPALTMPKVRSGASHSYYLHAMKFGERSPSIDRGEYVEAVVAELAPTSGRESDGTLVFAGYGKPLYLLPMYQQRVGIGSSGYPFDSPYNPRRPNYDPGLCPTAESVLDDLIVHELFRPPASKQDLNDVAEAFRKVWDHRDELSNG